MLFQSQTPVAPHTKPEEANVMRTRRNIDIVHYELDISGKPVSINYYPGSIEGKLWKHYIN